MPGPDAVYTHGHHESVLRSHRRRTAANTAAHLLPALASGPSVLDVGRGPGAVTADLAALVAPGEVVGVDRAEDVLAEARSTASARGLGAVEGGHTDRAGLERIAAARHEWGGRPGGWFSVSHGEILCRA